MSEEEALLRKSERTFAAADLLLEANNLESAASRAYYAWFYVAEALLLSLGVRSSRHGQVIAQYGLHWIAVFTAPSMKPSRFASTRITRATQISTPLRSVHYFGKAGRFSMRQEAICKVRAMKTIALGTNRTDERI